MLVRKKADTSNGCACQQRGERADTAEKKGISVEGQAPGSPIVDALGSPFWFGVAQLQMSEQRTRTWVRQEPFLSRTAC